jgi:hypothetical protein
MQANKTLLKDKWQLLQQAKVSKGEFKEPASDSCFLDLGTGMKKGKEFKRSGLSLPPPLEITPLVEHVFRFSATSGGTATISAADVIGALGTVCTVTNSTVRPFASSFRIKAVKLWSAVSSSTAFNESVVWTLATGSQMKDEEVSESFPTGVSVSRNLTSSPPKGTLAAMWQVANTNSLFTLQINAGSIVDLVIEYTLSNQFVSGTQSVSTGVLGNIYYLYLDGASAIMLPVGLPSTH